MPVSRTLRRHPLAQSLISTGGRSATSPRSRSFTGHRRRRSRRCSPRRRLPLGRTRRPRRDLPGTLQTSHDDATTESISRAGIGQSRHWGRGRQGDGGPRDEPVRVQELYVAIPRCQGLAGESCRVCIGGLSCSTSLVRVPVVSTHRIVAHLIVIASQDVQGQRYATPDHNPILAYRDRIVKLLVCI